MHLPFSSSLEAYQIIWVLLTEASCVVLLIITTVYTYAFPLTAVGYRHIPAYKRFVPAVSTNQGCQKPRDTIVRDMTSSVAPCMKDVRLI